MISYGSFVVFWLYAYGAMRIVRFIRQTYAEETKMFREHSCEIYFNLN